MDIIQPGLHKRLAAAPGDVHSLLPGQGSWCDAYPQNDGVRGVVLVTNSDHVDTCPVDIGKAGDDGLWLVLVMDVLHDILLSNSTKSLANYAEAVRIGGPRRREVASGDKAGSAREAIVIVLLLILRGLSQLATA